jgi:hypothetical protein
MTSLSLASKEAADQPTSQPRKLALAAPPQQPLAATSAAPPVFSAPVAAKRALSSSALDDRDAIAWLSEHIATLERVIYPAAVRHLPTDSDALSGQRVRTRELALLVRRLHARLDGDAATAPLDVAGLRDAVLVAVEEHTAREQELAGRLRAAMGASHWSELLARYTERLQHGPTRPHPHAPRGGLAGRFAYRLSTFADRTLDVLDSRAVHPIPE